MPDNTRKRSHGYVFTPAGDQPLTACADAAGEPVRGLWRRGEYYYGQFMALHADGSKKVVKRALGRFPSVAQAYTALEAVRTQALVVPLPRKAVRPPSPPPAAPAVTDPGARERPAAGVLFARVVSDYIQLAEAARIKRPRTLETERAYASRIINGLGDRRIASLRPPDLRTFLDAARAEGMGLRSSNMMLTVARNIARHALAQGLITADFTDGVRWVAYRKKQFPVVTAEHVKTFLDAVDTCPHVSAGRRRFFAGFLRFLMFSGGRVTESRQVRWEDVDWEQGQLVFGTRGDTKSGKTRFLDFNAPLKAHLLQLKAARDALPEWERSAFLFPGKTREAPVTHQALKGMHRRVIIHTGQRLGGFHNLRRFFCSWCVMQKVDFATVGRWVGHQDGGMLVAKTYARLSSPHTKAMAATLKADPLLQPSA